ncbi:MAG TPA: hypothetical protein VEK57_23675 [Thermoanaerobaculia bacterium]|nr:hypothetical protein [Thermoanaerobaculia bacterium]
MPEVEINTAEELRRAIERSRREMEHTGGADLRSIVAETAYDYWPQRAALARARQRATRSGSDALALSAIGTDERAALVNAIGRTQEALRGSSESGELDLAAIAREGSREYWAERQRLQKHESAVDLDVPVLAAMTEMLREGERTLMPRRERRKPWLDVVYDALAVAVPLFVITPLLLFAAQGRFTLPTVGPRKSALAFIDPSFSLTALFILFAGGSWLVSALRNPERDRRFLQFAGGLMVSLLAAVFGAAYIYGNRTTSRMDSIQATLSNGLLLSLAQSYDRGEVILPTQVDRSLIVRTRRLSASDAQICAETRGAKGEVCVELRPRSAEYSWVLNGRQIPKGALTVGDMTAFDPKAGTVTLRTGGEVTTYRYSGHLGMSLVGSRVAASLGTDKAIGSIVGLGSPRSNRPLLHDARTDERAQVQ